MQDLEAIEAILAKHRRVLQEQFHVRRIGIFGSYARGQSESLSDIDLLVELDQPVGWEIVDLHRHLEQILNLNVDLATKGAVVRKPLLLRIASRSSLVQPITQKKTSGADRATLGCPRLPT